MPHLINSIIYSNKKKINKSFICHFDQSRNSFYIFLLLGSVAVKGRIIQILCIFPTLRTDDKKGENLSKYLIRPQFFMLLNRILLNVS